MGEKLIFKYLLSDAWMIPISSFEIYDGKLPSVRFQFGWGIVEDPAFESRSLPLDAATVAEIKKFLDSVDVDSIEPLEHVMVLDGYTQSFFYISCGNEYNPMTFNLNCYLDRPELYPNAMRMVDLLNQLSELLIPLGVDQKLFALTRITEDTP